MRVEHIISRAKGQAFPSQVLALDVSSTWEKHETLAYGEREVFRSFTGAGMKGAGGKYAKERWCQGMDVSELWPHLARVLRSGGVCWCLSERASRVWTMCGLWSDIELGHVYLPGRDHRDARATVARGKSNRPGACTLEDPPFCLDVRIKGCPGTLKILDVANYGLAPSPEGTITSMRVSRILAFWRGMCDCVERWNLGTVKQTVASQSMAALRSGYLGHYFVAHANERALALEGEAYYGGRCEAFTLGALPAPTYHYDIASAYPSAYRSALLPLSLRSVRDMARDAIPDPCGPEIGRIAAVTVRTDEPDYPFRDQRQKLTIWPTGTFRAVLCGPELDDAQRLGRIVKWHRIAEYDMAPGLAAYGAMALELRDTVAHDADLKTWAKMLGNCIVGKMGQRDRKWVDRTRNDCYPLWNAWTERGPNNQDERWRSVAGYAQIEEDGGFGFDAIPSVAAWITSLGRMRLLQIIRCAGWPEVYYCDTDSVMVSQYGSTRLSEAGWLQHKEPGMLTLKCVSERTHVHGIKAYDERGIEVRAGRAKVVRGGNGGVARYSVNRRAVGSCGEGVAPDTLRVSIPWLGAGIYRHGKRTESGRVIPHQLEEK